jgi:hypothetical protein
MRLYRPLHPALGLACLVLALCPALATPPTASAAALSFIVTTVVEAPDAHPGDGVCATGAGQCSVRAAVQEADAQPRGTSSIITVPSGTYTLSLGVLVISNTVVISGAGSGTTQLIGQGDRVLVVARGTRAVVSGVTITGGTAGTSSGGGVANLGVLAVITSTLIGNTAKNGGGLYNGPSAWLALVDSRLDGNVVTVTGGGLVNDGGKVTLSGASVMSNTATYGAGGGIANTGALTVTGSTISGNTARLGGTQGGGIYNTGTLKASNSIFSGNYAYHGGGILNEGTM